MFTINEYVVYGQNGVCKIVDIRKEKFEAQEKLYYVMQPVYAKSSVLYSPVDKNMDKFRAIITREEIDELIHITPDETADWIDNDHNRHEYFRKVLKEGDPRELVKLIITLSSHRSVQASRGKKFHIADDRVMKEAEKVLYEEIAFVLDIPPDEVLPFILEQREAQQAV